MAMQASGIEVISFAQGEPDFDTPDNIKEAAYRAIQKGYTRYTPPAGFDDLKDAIIQKFKKDNNLAYDRSQIIVSAGAKVILYNLAQALIEAGDEVIVPSPYWVSYTDIVLLADGTPVVVPTAQEEGFKITPAKLKSAITPRTKAFMLNSPSNPTGAIYSPDELKALAEVLAGKNILIIADDIYEKFVYDGKTTMSIASLGKEVQEPDADTVLIIDDERVTQTSVRDILVKANYKVIVAGDGMEGFKSIISGKPHVILTDKVMPKFDGFALLLPQAREARGSAQFPRFRALPLGDLDEVNGSPNHPTESDPVTTLSVLLEKDRARLRQCTLILAMTRCCRWHTIPFAPVPADPMGRLLDRRHVEKSADEPRWHYTVACAASPECQRWPHAGPVWTRPLTNRPDSLGPAESA